MCGHLLCGILHDARTQDVHGPVGGNETMRLASRRWTFYFRAGRSQHDILEAAIASLDEVREDVWPARFKAEFLLSSCSVVG